VRPPAKRFARFFDGTPAILTRTAVHAAHTGQREFGLWPRIVVAHKGGNQTDPVYVANLRWMGHRSQFGLPFHSGKVYALSVLEGTVKGAQLASIMVV
jgi:hypothetical protein